MSIFAIDRFDENEWFLTIGVPLVYLILFSLPKKLPSSITLLLCIWAFTVSKFCDFTFGGGLFDYYDINDSPRYCLYDLVSYFFYAPFSYFFIYIYEQWRIKPLWAPVYILGWSGIALAIERLLLVFHVVTYKNGYNMFFSFVIYVFSQSLTIWFYKWLLQTKTGRSS